MCELPRTVLVVDDQRGIRRLVQRVLSDAGYRVIEAGNGADALDVFERAGRVDLVLVDVVMPRLDGAGFVRKLLERYPDQRVLCMSAQFVEVLAKYKVAELGLPFLAKPFRAAELVAKVGEVMRQPTGSRRAAVS